MVIKLNYQKSDLIGVFVKLTNSFCIVPQDVSVNFYKTIKDELNNKIPIISTFIFGSKSIGRLIIGNKRGIIVPYQTTTEEFNNLKSEIKQVAPQILESSK